MYRLKATDIAVICGHGRSFDPSKSKLMFTLAIRNKMNTGNIINTLYEQGYILTTLPEISEEQKEIESRRTTTRSLKTFEDVKKTRPVLVNQEEKTARNLQAQAAEQSAKTAIENVEKAKQLGECTVLHEQKAQETVSEAKRSRALEQKSTIHKSVVDVYQNDSIIQEGNIAENHVNSQFEWHIEQHMVHLNLRDHIRCTGVIDFLYDQDDALRVIELKKRSDMFNKPTKYMSEKIQLVTYMKALSLGESRPIYGKIMQYWRGHLYTSDNPSDSEWGTLEWGEDLDIWYEEIIQQVEDCFDTIRNTPSTTLIQRARLPKPMAYINDLGTIQIHPSLLGSKQYNQLEYTIRFLNKI
tara:strand:- start:583 stop:1647 length:1065 start_codon:yes stop_codon:yes gene_type:complete